MFSFDQDITNSQAYQKEQRFFYVCLFISLLLHAVILTILSYQTKGLISKPLKKIELTYQKITAKEDLPKSEDKFRELKVVQKKEQMEKESLRTVPLLKDTLEMPQKSFQDISKEFDPFQFDKSVSAKIETIDISRKVTVPTVSSEKITNPKYLSYNHQIGQIIKKLASQFFDVSMNDSGKVYLAFIISADGQLQQVQIVESKTTASEYLQSVALRSVRESAFPPLPADLNFPEISFNVVISFE